MSLATDTATGPSQWGAYFQRQSLPPARSFYERELGKLGHPNYKGWSLANCPFHEEQRRTAKEQAKTAERQRRFALRDEVHTSVAIYREANACLSELGQGHAPAYKGEAEHCWQDAHVLPSRRNRRLP